ncbi:MAG: HAD family hydrolase [Clostridia bacterium]|nr:HAD family hydrolase [Clostridia bacterium]
MAFSTEIIRPYKGRGVRCALFDFDGTISLIREGWQQIMTPYFCECVEALGTGEPRDAIEAEVREFIDRLTGKQTIFQCIALDEAIVRRGGPHREPLVYKTEYLRRLAVHIADRKKGLADGTIKKEALTVKGAREILIGLREAGIKCYLASGTDEPDVMAEAELLGVDSFFDGGIHGARDGLTDCSKEAVIKELLESERVQPEELVTFGDGCVEIELTAAIGGYAVGVATDEKTGDGVDPWKRGRLLSAGAAMIIPHFAEPETVLKALGL